MTAKPKAFLDEIGVSNLGLYRDATIGVFNTLKKEGLAFRPTGHLDGGERRMPAGRDERAGRVGRRRRQGAWWPGSKRSENTKYSRAAHAAAAALNKVAYELLWSVEGVAWLHAEFLEDDGCRTKPVNADWIRLRPTKYGQQSASRAIRKHPKRPKAAP
jgi:hypothetical protein